MTSTVGLKYLRLEGARKRLDVWANYYCHKQRVVINWLNEQGNEVVSTDVVGGSPFQLAKESCANREYIYPAGYEPPVYKTESNRIATPCELIYLSVENLILGTPYPPDGLRWVLLNVHPQSGLYEVPARSWETIAVAMRTHFSPDCAREFHQWIVEKAGYAGRNPSRLVETWIRAAYKEVLGAC